MVYLRGLCCYFFLLFLAATIPANAALKLHDADARVELGEKQLLLKLPITELGETQHVAISLKFLDPNGKVRSSSEANVILKPSQKEITASISDPLQHISEGDQDDLFWYRLNYEIRVDSGQLLASGIVPVSVAHSELFRIAVAAGHYACVGRSYEVEVNAVNPLTHQPVRGVTVDGKFDWGEDEDSREHQLAAHAVTDSFGNARLSFKLAADITGQAGLEVNATKGVLSRKVEKELALFPARIILLDSDKPIYQPGQALHLRSLLVDSQHKVVPDTELEVTIRDEDNTILFRNKVTTDSFGVAHTDWAIPANLRMGTYTIESRLPHPEDEDSAYERFYERVRIYRYDLPNFSVTATPDHPYYLSGQNASIKISAEYLFGKPVKRAKVRVVEEQERHWNYREQKWDADEGQAQTGELNENGEFNAKLDLSHHHQELAENTYRRFQSIDVGAYVTDLTTGRTEQRRFQIRITRDPIHIYYVQGDRYTGKGPLNAYASTFYADGTPARCAVQISAVDGDSPEKTHHLLQTIKTNKYGLAKINNLQFSLQDKEDSLLFEAQDAKGSNGKEIEHLWQSSGEPIHLSTPRTIYKPGEGLDVSIFAPQPGMRLLLNVMQDGEVLASQRVALHGRNGFATFPYDPRFSGAVTIFALSLGTADSSFDFPCGNRTILFPKKRKLALQVRFDKDTYRPGESGSARINVKMPEGGGAESELGVKIIDQAVQERARTDQEFGSSSRRWSYWGYWGDDNNFGGLTRDDFDNLDLTEPVPEDLDLVAEYLMNADSRFDFPEVELSSEVRSADTVFSALFNNQFKDLEAAAR